MRRVSGGQGKATPNANAEPDFDDIEKKYPLRPAEEPQHQGQGKVVVKKAEVHFHDYDHGPLNFLGDSDLGKEASTSKNKDDAPLMLLARATYSSKKDAEATLSDHKKTDFLGDFDVGEESSVTNDDSIPYLAGKPPARDSESLPNTNTSQDQVWDPLPFKPIHPPLHEAATKPHYDDNNAHPAKQLSHMFPPHASYHNHHQYQDPDTNHQYFGSNINQYASSTPFLGSAGFHHHFPTTKLDRSNNSSNSAFGHYHHGHDHYQYYSNSSYGHGYNNQFEYPGYEQQPLGDGSSIPPPPPQMNYPARDQSLPNFSPMKSKFEGKSEEEGRHKSTEVDESQDSQLPPG